MRTAVGQARLLMKERFKQFSGLVEDCELGRGEKITTCTDLQGFWDMVYYQVGVHRRTRRDNTVFQTAILMRALCLCRSLRWRMSIRSSTLLK